MVNAGGYHCGLRAAVTRPARHAPNGTVALDADDIARLYAAHSRALVAFFARRTFDPQTASELMAETFAAAVADRQAFRGAGDEAAAAWLYGSPATSFPAGTGRRRWSAGCSGGSDSSRRC